MKKIYLLFSLAFCIILLESGVNGLNFSSVPPQGRTGATGSYCTACHGDFSLNTAGGSVTVTGLPAGGYVPSQVYNLTLTINHAATDRKRWGFSMKAVNSGGTSIGTLGSTNANAALNGTELSHNNAVTTANANTFTYSNLNWTAPPSASGTVTFYYVGNAADGTGGSNNDYIYAASTPVTLPIELNNFSAVNDNNNIVLRWQTSVEINSNYFDVERSDDGQFFFNIGKVEAKGNTTSLTNYSFTDTKASFNNGSQIFYRLKLVDKDGSVKYSNHISIKPVFNGITIKNIYPTIIRNGDQVFTEIASDKAKSISLIVLDVSGKALQQLNFNLNVGNNKINFTPKVIAKGMIFLKFVTDNFQQTKTLILQ